MGKGSMEALLFPGKAGCFWGRQAGKRAFIFLGGWGVCSIFLEYVL
jgi:hypothetical protein